MIDGSPNLITICRVRGVATMNDEASYCCSQCGEEIVVPVDFSAGSEQTYVEDCPVCCHPQVLHVDIGPNGAVVVRGEAE